MYINALKVSIKKWIWLFNNPDKDETENPAWEKTKNLFAQCPLCEIFINRSYNGLKFGFSYLQLCNNCPLSSIENNCFLNGSPYSTWHNLNKEGYSYKHTKKQCAARIVCILRRTYEKETGDKETFRTGGKT